MLLSTLTGVVCQVARDTVCDGVRELELCVWCKGCSMLLITLTGVVCQCVKGVVCC